MVFIADTHVRPEPSAENVAETVIAAARHVRRFGLNPKVALLSHSQFGSLDTPSGRKMREALEILDSRPRDFEYEGEMHADTALDPTIRERLFPGSRLDGRANVLVFAERRRRFGDAQHSQTVRGRA